ncbi:hypothetical protein B0A48_15472 [Cryoendolithus antarcticus]|uniref:Uncharacterized protein n=1 Tax=Cryoendolithus antarcticus TaxID=1507870 RepID=A0A1V8SGD9_9PEZI|nr:hypothetical protein B0A48_15472 [Cryoendolithus antarcticus]
MNELVFSRRFVYNGFNGTHEAIVTLDDHNFTDQYPDPDSQKLSVCDWSTIEALTETLPCSGAPLADGHRDQYMPGTYFENVALTPQGQEVFGDTLKNHLNQLSMATELPFANFAKSYNRSTGVSLQDALEELFQNFTISLLSEPYLHSPYTPEPSALVTFSTFHNVYTYSYRTLWIAYGLAIVFATLSVLGGAIALLLNGASYSTTFSTIVRVGRTVQLSEEVSAADGEGFEPLPKHLAKAKVRFPHTRSGSAAPSSEASREREKEPSVNVKSQLLSPEEAERRDARMGADPADR